MIHPLGFIFFTILLSVSNLSYGFTEKKFPDGMGYFVEGKRELTINTISLQDQSVWNYNKEKILNLGYLDGVVWLRIPIRQDQTNHMLLLENCHLDSMAIYQFAGNKLIAQSIQGDLVTFSSRTYKYRFPNTVIQPTVNEVFVQISAKANFRIPILLLSQEDFYQYTTTSQFVYFIYLGILLLALVVYFFLIDQSLDVQTGLPAASRIETHFAPHPERHSSLHWV